MLDAINKTKRKQFEMIKRKTKWLEYKHSVKFKFIIKRNVNEYISDNNYLDIIYDFNFNTTQNRSAKTKNKRAQIKRQTPL